jgi:hypothetical protein
MRVFDEDDGVGDLAALTRRYARQLPLARLDVVDGPPVLDDDLSG